MYDNCSIIMSFPGCGRTVAMEKLKDKGIDSEYIDVDVFRCRKEKDKIIFIDLFPYNLNEYIKEAYYKNRYLFISFGFLEMNILKSLNIPFTLFYPRIELYDEYLDRYDYKNDDKSFREYLYSWDDVISDCENDFNCTRKVLLKTKEYLSDFLIELK